jgi:hypothetical protein
MSFTLNNQVEKFLTEESTVSFENILSYDQLQELKKIALEFLGVNDGEIIGNADFWIRKGGIEHNEYIQKFSEQHLKKLLPRIDTILIGDTAFIMNYPPHDIHIDCRDFRMQEDRRGIISYKSVVIPLEVTANEYPILYTANQYFYGPTTRFRAGSEQQDNNSEVHRQKAGGIQFSYDYQNDGMKYISKTNLTQEWYDANIDANLYTPYSNFKGISIEKENLWKPGNIIMFDSARIHFGSNIKKKGAKFKIGLSLNYGLKVDI